jgi:peptide deformylase
MSFNTPPENMKVIMDRKVLLYPDALLKRVSEEITGPSPELTELIDDLEYMMVSSGHSVGIAAPQVGVGVRLVVADASLGKKASENHGRLVLINPEIIKHSGFITTREGCMSVPEYTGNVGRAANIVLQYLDRNFERRVIDAEGFEAVLLQHEIDHLDGMLFIDRVISRRTDLFHRKS